MAQQEKEEPHPQEAAQHQAERLREEPQEQEAVPPQGAVYQKQEKEQGRQAVPPQWPQEAGRQPTPGWGWPVPMVRQPVETR